MSPHQDKVTQEINTAQQIMDAIPPVAEEFKKNGSFEVLPLFLFRGPEGSALKIVFESTNDDGRFAKKQADEIVEKLNESLQKHRVPAEADTRYAREQILNRDGTEAGAKYHDIYRHRRLK